MNSKSGFFGVGVEVLHWDFMDVLLSIEQIKAPLAEAKGEKS
jgi:hypothetical protein